MDMHATKHFKQVHAKWCTIQVGDTRIQVKRDLGDLETMDGEDIRGSKP